MRRALTTCFLLAALQAGCGGCESSGVTSGRSNLEASTAALDFGRVFIGTEARLTFNLTASGELAINYQGRLDGDAGGYGVAPGGGILARNEVREVLVAFRPTVAGERRATLIFESDATENASVAITLFAVGVEPPDCEDGNGCTADTFDPATGRCSHVAERVACDDFDACTVRDTCVDAVCLGESLSCDDNDPCTDDFCDPAGGCVHDLTMSCDDGNPCTADMCDRNRGCMHVDLDDGTPCDDFQICTTADICLLGECRGVNVPEGTACDDGDPCSKNDQCIEGLCDDPTYEAPGPGQIKFATDVGRLASGGGANPIIDRDSNTYIGTIYGVVSVDQCGEVLWDNDTLGEPTWTAALSLPGLIVVPFEDRLLDLDAASGEIFSELSLRDVFGPLPAGTSSTATSAVRIIDAAARASGALVLSVARRVEDGERVVEEGLLAEVDRSHSVATRFLPIGSWIASRVAIDRDESVIAVLRRGEAQRLVRFGIEGVPGGSWSTTATASQRTEVAIGPSGEVIWTQGLISVRSPGVLSPLLDDPVRGLAFDSGAPVIRGDGVVVWSRPVPLAPMIAPGVLPPNEFELVAVELPRTTTASADVLWRVPLTASAEGSSPAIDSTDRTFIVTKDGLLSQFRDDGELAFALELPITDFDRVSVGISHERIVVIAADGKIIGVQATAGLAGSSWPRHRRDNLSTGHR